MLLYENTSLKLSYFCFQFSTSVVIFVLLEIGAGISALVYKDPVSITRSNGLAFE